MAYTTVIDLISNFNITIMVFVIVFYFSVLPSVTNLFVAKIVVSGGFYAID